jgi:hypothetical protein
MRGWSLVGAALAVAGLAAACETKVCTLRGCQDQLHATITSGDGSIPPGMHLVEVTADGATLSCTFQVPSGAGTAAAQCPSGLQVLVGQRSDCTDIDTGSARVLECRPIPGSFFEDITVIGQPRVVRVRVIVEGAVVLDRTESPTYEEALPNGPGCDPTCHQASVQWIFAVP